MLNIFGCDIKEICKHLNNVQWGRISKLESYIGCKFKIFFHSLYFSLFSVLQVKELSDSPYKLKWTLFQASQ